MLTKGNDSLSVLGIKDVSMENTRVAIVVKSSKINQLGKGVTVVLSAQDSHTCPVKSMLGFLHVRPQISGPLFCHYGVKPLTRYQFSAVLDKAIVAIGLDKRFYKSYSFRIGAASTAYQKEFSDEDIKIAGRWKSSAFQTYIRSPLACSKPMG